MPCFHVVFPRSEHAQQELYTIRAEPFLGTKHVYRKKWFCLQGGVVSCYFVNFEVKLILLNLCHKTLKFGFVPCMSNRVDLFRSIDSFIIDWLIKLMTCKSRGVECTF